MISLFSSAQQQGDTLLPYERYRLNPVIYTDLGFSTAPLKIVYPFEEGINRLKFKNNMSAVLGIGFSYKWFALRIGLTIPGTIRSQSHYGKTRYYDIGFDFTVRRFFIDVDLHNYSGYVIKDAYRWNDTLTPHKNPNELRPDINSTSFSINAWQFRSKNFKMQAFRGKTGAYKKDIHTMYFKYTFNIHGMGSELESNSITPVQLQDSSQTKTLARRLTALDIGVVPGMAYVKRWKTYQIGAMAGLGLVVQSKFYGFDGGLRGFLGLAPRFDFKFIAGYNQPRYFLMFVADFDNKSIRFNNFAYRQTFYSLKIVGGIRLNQKKKSVAEEKADKFFERKKAGIVRN
jgi:hypothetical protein